MKTAMHNPSGSLTAYAFSCGYIEATEGPRFGVRLWQEGCYHVRWHHVPAEPGDPTGYIRESWEAFDTLTAARRWYRKEARKALDPTTTEAPHHHS